MMNPGGPVIGLVLASLWRRQDEPLLSGSPPLLAAGRSRRRPGDRLGHAAVGQRVGALVARVSGVALDPEPLHVMPRGRRVQAPPQLLVLHRLLAGGPPVV